MSSLSLKSCAGSAMMKIEKEKERQERGSI
jgi:hypothetical protein